MGGEGEIETTPEQGVSFIAANTDCQALQGIPRVHMPRTQRFRPNSPDEVFSRATAEGFDFPFIVRVAGLHGGVSMVKVDSREAYSALHALPFDGREFYLAEFVDYRSKDGLFRKLHRIRIVTVEHVVLREAGEDPRSLLVGTELGEGRLRGGAPASLRLGEERHWHYPALPEKAPYRSDKAPARLQHPTLL